ncbi:MAG: ROK family protein, partial [Halanaerobiales bacterium]
AVVIDINGQILIHTNRMLDGNTEKDYILNEVKQVIKELLSEEDYQNRIIGVGIGMHGLVDYARGISVFPPAFGWKDVPVADIIQKEFNLPVIIENNVRALTLAENWFGYARKLNNFICLKVGSGIGSSIFTDGKIYRGASNSAGEIGHTMVDEDGPLCSCGNYGCLESMASIPAMIRQAQKALKQGAESSIKELVNHEIDKIDEETIFLAADQGDHLARRILHDAGRYLGVAIADLINILNPEAVIVSGKIARAGDLILDSIRSTVRNRALSYSLQNVQIINSRMDKEGVAIGAAALILESVFNIDQNNSVDIGL